MAAEYEVVLKNPMGRILAVTGQATSIDMTRTANAVGNLELDLPLGIVPNYYFGCDSIVEVWRCMTGGRPYLLGETIWFVRKIAKKMSADGLLELTLKCVDPMDLLKRKIVPYSSESSYSLGNDCADNICRAITRQNLGSLSTDTARSLATWLSIQGDNSLGPAMVKAYSKRTVLDVLQEIADASYTLNNVYLAFDIISTCPPSGLGLQFQAYVGARGQDRRMTTQNRRGLVLSAEAGCLTEIERSDDWSDLANYIYSAGQGVGDDVLVQPVYDQNSINLSPFNRVEEYFNAQCAIDNTAGEIIIEGQAELRNRRVKRSFTARTIDTPAIMFDRDFHYGDFLTTSFAGDWMDARVVSMNDKVGDSTENISASLKSDT